MLLKREHALGQGESESDQPLGPVVRHLANVLREKIRTLYPSAWSVRPGFSGPYGLGAGHFLDRLTVHVHVIT
jgi:hypothetical protein